MHSVYTGYVDVTGARHLFFTYYESRRDPENDDVVLWLNGGACRLCWLAHLVLSHKLYRSRRVSHAGHAHGTRSVLPSYLPASLSFVFSYARLSSRRSLYGRLSQFHQVQSLFLEQPCARLHVPHLLSSTHRGV
jgi:hypothetical protein